MAVFAPNLQLVRYMGETPRKLWEIKARSVPTLNRGDLVLLNDVTAILMVKKYGFEMVDNSKLEFSENFAGEIKEKSTENFAGEIKDETTQEESTETQEESTEIKDESTEIKDEYKLPNASEIMNLSDEEIKEACKYVGISTGKKTIETLRSLLMAYLPTE